MFQSINQLWYTKYSEQKSSWSWQQFFKILLWQWHLCRSLCYRIWYILLNNAQKMYVKYEVIDHNISMRCVLLTILCHVQVIFCTLFWLKMYWWLVATDNRLKHTYVVPVSVSAQPMPINVLKIYTKTLCAQLPPFMWSVNLYKIVLEPFHCIFIMLVRMMVSWMCGISLKSRISSEELNARLGGEAIS